MRVYYMLLRELTDRPEPWKWDDIDHVSYTAVVPSLDFMVQFFHHYGMDDDSWELAFDMTWESDRGEAGNEFAKFSTVVDVVKAFIKMRKPKQITFSCFGESRARLYKRLVDRFAVSLGYQSKIIPEQGYIRFEIARATPA